MTFILTFNCNYFDKKENTFLDRIFKGGIFRAQSGVQDGAFCKFINRFKLLTVFGKGVVWDFWQVSECDSVLTNNFLFYTLACPIKVYLQISFSSGLCCVETIQLICKANRLSGFCMIQVFVEAISEQNVVQFYYWKQPLQSVLLSLYLWQFPSWCFCRLLVCSFI